MTNYRKTIAVKAFAFLLAAMLVIPAFTPAVYGTSSQQAVQTTENVEEEMEFLYVESPILEAPGTENIAVAWNERITGASDLELVFSGEDGNQYTMAEKERTSDSVLFSRDFTTAETGTYYLEGISYTAGGQEEFFNFNEVEIAASFTVVNEVTEPASPDNIAVTDITDSNLASGEVSSLVTETLESTSPGLLPSAANDGKLVVVLDPGHGSREPGASGNGIKEHEAVSKIAKYCKAELETYEGIEVYVTHNGSGFSGTAAERMQVRIDYAVSVSADAFISLHINAGGGYGAEIWYPHENYVPEVHPIGKGLAENIQEELVALGLRDRGIQVKPTQNDRYPDGSLQDYYGVIRRCKLAGIPGIIVEHAFIDSADDVAKYLDSDEKLKTLAIADAKGIADYYGLEKKAEGTDVTPPALLSYEYESESITTPDTMRINISVEDKDSTPEKVEVTLTNSVTGKILKSSDFVADTGSVRNGYVEFSFPRYSNLGGKYYVSELTVTDSNGYTSIYNSYDTTLEKKFFTVEDPDTADSVTSTEDIDQAVEELTEAEEGETVVIVVSPEKDSVPAEIFEAIAGKDVTVVLEATSPEGLAEGVGVQWIVNGLDADPDKVKDIAASIQIIEAPEKDWNGETDIDGNFLRIIFPSNGQLPCEMTIRIKPSPAMAEWMATGDLKLFFLEGKEYVPVEHAVTDNGDGTYSFTVTHNSEYAIASEAEPVIPPADNGGTDTPGAAGTATETGDESNMTIPIVLVLAGLLTMIVAFFLRRS